jgi:hypothetical protein
MIAVWVAATPLPEINEGTEISVRLHIATNPEQLEGLNIVGVATKPTGYKRDEIEEIVWRRTVSRVGRPKRLIQLVRENLCR